MTDSQSIYQAAELLMCPGHVYELRIPNAGSWGTLSGYFDSAQELAHTVAELDGKHPGIYLTLNPVNPALLARAYNHLKPFAKRTTADVDVVKRIWFALDFDPIRPADISSTDSEHGRAVAVALGVWDELRTMGWPDPIVASSGNGAHLLYRIDLPNTPDVTEQIRKAIVGIAGRCSTPDVTIDTAVYNAARIWKLYGTMSCKGDSAPDRPHRRSKLLEIPNTMSILMLRSSLARN